MFDFISVSAPLILDGEEVKVWNLSRMILFSGYFLATFQIKAILIITRLSGKISPTIQPDGWIAEKQAG